jgi:hypothetical protein
MPMPTGWKSALYNWRKRRILNPASNRGRVVIQIQCAVLYEKVNIWQ